jgi:hypothetical protein
MRRPGGSAAVDGTSWSKTATDKLESLGSSLARWEDLAHNGDSKSQYTCVARPELTFLCPTCRPGFCPFVLRIRDETGESAKHGQEPGNSGFGPTQGR